MLAFCFNSELCTHCVNRNIWILVFQSWNAGGGKCLLLNVHKASRVFNHPHRKKSFRMILLSFFLLYIQADSRCCEQSRIFFRYSWCLDQHSTETVTCETLEQTNQPSAFIFVLMVACWYFLKAWCLLAYRRSTKLFCFFEAVSLQWNDAFSYWRSNISQKIFRNDRHWCLCIFGTTNWWSTSFEGPNFRLLSMTMMTLFKEKDQNFTQRQW